MGFLKRLFSVGSKKNKSRGQPSEYDTNELRRYDTSQSMPLISEEAEADASRLLRSASARWAVVSESDYPPLPPLPHPVNNIAATPAGSPTCASTTQGRGTYVVKVYQRTLHSCTEFPNANPTMETPRPRKRSVPMPEDSDDNSDDEGSPRGGKSAPITPRDQNRLHRLRQDPSVASLLNLYDEHGRLDSDIFSNTPSPSREGRPQCGRTGSTLRQLMGNPKSDLVPNTSSNEGDISWAERFLEEQNFSTVPPESFSFGPRAPAELSNTYDHSNDIPHVKNDKHVTFISENDSTANSSNNPAISSLDVELSSNSAYPSDIIPSNLTSPYLQHDPETQQRASQIFHFLTEKRKSKEERTLATLLKSTEDDIPLLPDFGSESNAPAENVAFKSQDPESSSRIPRLRTENQPPKPAKDEKVYTSQLPRTRGSRSSNRPKMSSNEQENALNKPTYHKAEKSTHIPTSSSSRLNRPLSSYTEANTGFFMSPKKCIVDENKPTRSPSSKRKPVPLLYEDCSTRAIAPMTPAYSRPVLSPGGNFAPASPASSTEMSPLGQQIMANARKTRYASLRS